MFEKCEKIMNCQTLYAIHIYVWWSMSQSFFQIKLNNSIQDMKYHFFTKCIIRYRKKHSSSAKERMNTIENLIHIDSYMIFMEMPYCDIQL